MSTNAASFGSKRGIRKSANKFGYARNLAKDLWISYPLYRMFGDIKIGFMNAGIYFCVQIALFSKCLRRYGDDPMVKCHSILTRLEHVCWKDQISELLVLTILLTKHIFYIEL